MKSWKIKFFSSPKMIFSKSLDFQNCFTLFNLGKNRNVFVTKKCIFQKVWIFKVVLFYFRTISEGWNLGGKSKNRDQKMIFPEKLEFSKLFYSILEPFLRDLGKKWKNPWPKNWFFKKFEFSVILKNLKVPIGSTKFWEVFILTLKPLCRSESKYVFFFAKNKEIYLSFFIGTHLLNALTSHTSGNV